jgi:hypothetical protein
MSETAPFYHQFTHLTPCPTCKGSGEKGGWIALAKDMSFGLVGPKREPCEHCWALASSR